MTLSDTLDFEKKILILNLLPCVNISRYFNTRRKQMVAYGGIACGLKFFPALYFNIYAR